MDVNNFFGKQYDKNEEDRVHHDTNLMKMKSKLYLTKNGHLQ